MLTLMLNDIDYRNCTSTYWYSFVFVSLIGIVYVGRDSRSVSMYPSRKAIQYKENDSVDPRIRKYLL